jgi:hypothetical protein
MGEADSVHFRARLKRDPTKKEIFLTFMKILQSSHLTTSFLESAYALMRERQLPEKLIRIRTSMQGRQIISHLHAFGRGKDEADESDSDNPKTQPPPSDSHLSSRRI